MITPNARLQQLLEKLFDPSGLRLFLSTYTDYRPLVAELPDSPCALNQLSHAAVGALDRHGLINGALFDRLREQRPNQESRIGLYRRECLAQQAAPAQGGAQDSRVRGDGTQTNVSEQNVKVQTNSGVINTVSQIGDHNTGVVGGNLVQALGGSPGDPRSAR